MIDNPDMLTPDTLRSEARNIRYSGRAHAAQIMEWAADRIAELEEQLDIGPCATCQRERDIAEGRLEVVLEGRAELEARLAAVAEMLRVALKDSEAQFDATQAIGPLERAVKLSAEALEQKDAG